MSRAPVVHYTQQFRAGFTKGGLGPSEIVHVPLCRRRGPETSVPVNRSDDPANTTCKRCLALLATEVEDQLVPYQPVHYLIKDPAVPYPFLCNAPGRTKDGPAISVTNIHRVTCSACQNAAL